MHNTGQLTTGFLSSSPTFKIRWFTSNSDHFIYFESNSDQIIYFESLNLLIIYTTLVCSRNSTFSILPNLKKKKNVLQNKLPKAHQCQVQMAVRPPTVRDSLHHPPIGTENWELTPPILSPLPGRSGFVPHLSEHSRHRESKPGTLRHTHWSCPSQL